MGWLLRLLLFLLLIVVVLQAAWRVVQGIFEGASGRRRAGAARDGVPAGARRWCAIRSAAPSWYSRAR